MNLFKRNNIIRYHFHPGIYEFNFPFLNYYRVPDEEGKAPVRYVAIRMKVGEEFTKSDKLVSVKYYEDNDGLSIQSFIVNISNQVTNTIIKDIFNGQIPIGAIEWYEEHHLLGERKLFKVEMEWDAKDKTYINTPEFDLISIEECSEPIKLKNFSVEHEDWKLKN